MQTFRELEDAIWKACSDILAGIITDPTMIRWKHPTDGMPDWKITDNILFLNLDEKDDAYAQQRHSLFNTVNGTVIRSAYRTRVWTLYCTAYGPESYAICNRLKDGFFEWNVEAPLWRNDIHLVPDLPRCRQTTEIFAGQWWERWDIELTFNELYVAQDDVGHIEHVTLVHDVEKFTETQIITTENE